MTPVEKGQGKESGIGIDAYFVVFVKGERFIRSEEKPEYFANGF